MASVIPDSIFGVDLATTWDGNDGSTTNITSDLTDSNSATFVTVNSSSSYEGIRIQFTGFSDLQSGDTISINVENLGSWSGNLALLPYDSSTTVNSSHKLTLTPHTSTTETFTLDASFLGDLSDLGSDSFAVRIVEDGGISSNGLEISEVTSNLTVYREGIFSVSGYGETDLSGLLETPVSLEGLQGPIPHPVSSTLVIPTYIKYSDNPLSMQFDLSNVGDTATPAEDWGVILKLIGNFGSRTTVYYYEYTIPASVVIEPKESYTFKGLFHPNYSHVTLVNNILVEEGVPLTQGKYYFDIIANRNDREVPYFVQEPGTYSLNFMFGDSNLGEITIFGDEPFKKGYEKYISKCHNILSLKPKDPIRRRFLKCTRIGIGSLPTSVTKPGTVTVPTVSIPGSTTTTTTTEPTFTTTTTPPTTPGDIVTKPTPTAPRIPPFSTPTEPGIIIQPIDPRSIPGIVTRPTTPTNPTTPTFPTVPTDTLPTVTFPDAIVTIPVFTNPNFPTTPTFPTVPTAPTLPIIIKTITQPTAPRLSITTTTTSVRTIPRDQYKSVPTFPTIPTTEPTTPTNPVIVIKPRPTAPKIPVTTTPSRPDIIRARTNPLLTTTTTTPTLPTIPTIVFKTSPIGEIYVPTITLPTLPTNEFKKAPIVSVYVPSKTFPTVPTNPTLPRTTVIFQPGRTFKNLNPTETTTTTTKGVFKTVDPRRLSVETIFLSKPTFGNLTETLPTTTIPRDVFETVPPIGKLRTTTTFTIPGSIFEPKNPRDVLKITQPPITTQPPFVTAPVFNTLQEPQIQPTFNTIPVTQPPIVFEPRIPIGIPKIIIDFELARRAVRLPQQQQPTQPTIKYEIVKPRDQYIERYKQISTRDLDPTIEISVPTFNVDPIKTEPTFQTAITGPILEFTELDKGSLDGISFTTVSPIVNYWETIDLNPPTINSFPEEPITTTKVEGLPRNYVPFLGKEHLNITKEEISTNIDIPALGAVSPGSLTRDGDFRPYLDKHNIIYSGGYPVSIALINKLVGYYEDVGINNAYLKKVNKEITITNRVDEEVRARFFNTLAGNGLIWPSDMPDWYIPWMQKNEGTSKGNFLIFNPKLYQTASKLFSFNKFVNLKVSTPKNFQAELKYNRELGIPEKIVAVIKSNTIRNIKSFKTPDIFVDTTVSNYEVITDIDELSSKFQAPAEVIYIYYDDPILRLLLYQSAEITLSRDQFTMKSFGDTQLIYTIPKCLIIIPTDDPTRCSLRGAGSRASSFGTRNINLTQSTVPEEWDSPSKPVLETIGTYKDVWGYNQLHPSELRDNGFTYPEGTFRLVFSDTKKPESDWLDSGKVKVDALTKTIFEKFKEKQDEALSRNPDLVPDINSIISMMSLEDQIALRNSVDTGVLREISEGDVTGISAPASPEGFNSNSSSRYKSVDDVVNGAIKSSLKAKDEANKSADSALITDSDTTGVL